MVTTAPPIVNHPAYRIELRGNGVFGVVWRRPEIDAREGARLAHEMYRRLEQVLSQTPAATMILDLSDAPPVAGPITQERLGALFAFCAREHHRFALVHGATPIQALQLKRLVRENAPDHGALVEDLAAAESWIAAGRAP